MKKLVVFDLDNTLTESKTLLDIIAAELLNNLLAKTNVAVISGASFQQFETQFIKPLNASVQNLSHLFILPTSGAELCVYDDGWKKIYSETLSDYDKKRVKEAFAKAISITDKELDNRLDDRGTGMTYSALGQDASLETKRSWDPDHKKRDGMRSKLLSHLAGLEVRIGGTTSIDVTKSGIDKAFGVNKLLEYLKLSKSDAVFIGDALFEGGNDNAVMKLGIETRETSGPTETKEIIKNILESK
jgi:HAD superfamily hydrolase (TIGR01484 family)